ncbi:MAG: hypothetical protein DHS20C15_04790 [Planctomycetota bacterium]|nr:MAG: hypothetical protein DHS20C15_04790 [Planctomycetota bacterium]
MTTPRRRPESDLMRFAHLGALGAAAIVGFGFLGWKLDAWLDSFPLLAIAGALLGALGWMLIVVREASTLGGSQPDYDTHDESSSESPDPPEPSDDDR